MGHEFIAVVDGDKHFSLEKIGGELCSANGYILERSMPGEINLRLANQERRPDWPEDFCLCHHDGKLLLTIHGATRRDKTKIIGDIQSVFSHQGVSLAFEEI